MGTSSLGSMIAARWGLGVGEAAARPACNRVVRQWFPVQERGLVTAIFHCSVLVSAALGSPLAAWLVIHTGWRLSFVIMGAIGFVWLACWLQWFAPRVDIRHGAAHRDPSRGAGRRGGDDIFLMGKARLAMVRVRVDDAWQHMQPSDVHHPMRVRHFSRCGDRCYDSAGYGDVGLDGPALGNDGAALQHEVNSSSWIGPKCEIADAMGSRRSRRGGECRY